MSTVFLSVGVWKVSVISTPSCVCAAAAVVCV